jgi:hypothetical protein
VGNTASQSGAAVHISPQQPQTSLTHSLPDNAAEPSKHYRRSYSGILAKCFYDTVTF